MDSALCYSIWTTNTRITVIFTAANWAALGILYNTGQDCTAGSRLFVQDTVYDTFIPLLVEKAKQLNITNGFDDTANGGPVVHFDLSII